MGIFRYRYKSTQHDTPDTLDALPITLVGFGFTAQNSPITHHSTDVRTVIMMVMMTTYVSTKHDGKYDDDEGVVYLPFAEILLLLRRIKRLNKKPSTSTLNAQCVL